MSRRVRSSLRISLMSGAITLSLLIGLFGSVSTALAVTCSGSGCNNTSPVTTGCSTGGVTKKTATIVNGIWPYQTLGKVELRYSPTCKTVWSRVTITDPNGPYNIGTETKRTNSIPPAIPYSVSDVDYEVSSGGSAYSPQIYLPASSTDGFSAKAFGSIFLPDVTNGSNWTALWTGV